MRKGILILLLAVFLISSALTASAAVRADTISLNAIVSDDESCHVTLDCTLYVDQTLQKLRFPVPLEATNVYLGTTRVWPQRASSCQYVDLSGLYGTQFRISYTLPDVIQTGAEGIALLQLPLLSGFEYAISRLDFSITLPGQVTEKPAFSSGYHQASIERELTSTVSGSTVLGNTLSELKDHETLTMTVRVDPELFPNAPVELFDSQSDDTAMIISALLALVYWIVFLRCLPPRRRLSFSAPEGCGAGQAGATITLGKLDLTMMVFSWAQLGYVLIQIDRHGRVLLHKRMDMGNERSSLEQKCFRGLFGARSYVDTSGLQYATFLKKVAAMSPNFQSSVHPRSGNPRLFRALAALVGLFGGISVGISLTQGAPAQGVFVFFITLAFIAASWVLQGWASCLFLYDKRRLWHAAVAGVVILITGFFADQLSLTVWLVLSQLLAGLMAFYGGRRTDAGRQDLSQLLGLRRYLKTVPQEHLERIHRSDPEHFHTLAPYALAFGVDKAFAKGFGKEKLPACPYLTTGMDGHRTAGEWSELYRQAVQSMNRRARSMPMERLGEFFSFFKR